MAKFLKTSFFLFFLLSGFSVFAQRSSTNKTLTYEELYDSPYEIAKLYIHVMPIYGEYFTTNSTAGFGLAAHYYHKDKFDIYAHGRSSYTRQFDLVREAAFRNRETANDNSISPYGFFELIGTYHVKDEEEDTETKFILYSKRYKGDRWAATVPMNTVIPTKLRKIYGVRLGGMAYNTGVSYNDLAERQEFEMPSEVGGEQPLDLSQVSVYGDLSVQGFYLGGSLALIKNVAVEPDKIYSTLVNDLIFTVFADVILTPFVNLDDIFHQGIQYSTDQIETNMFGFRAGIEGKFNRNLGWSYSGEIGSRPGLKGHGFYTMIRFSFPVFGSQMNNRVESFGK